MPGDVGLLAKLLDGIMRFATDEDGYADWKLRRDTDRILKEYREAVHANDSLRATLLLRDLKRLREGQGP